jgi:hypothetical protein
MLSRAASALTNSPSTNTVSNVTGAEEGWTRVSVWMAGIVEPRRS